MKRERGGTQKRKCSSSTCNSLQARAHIAETAQQVTVGHNPTASGRLIQAQQKTSLWVLPQACHTYHVKLPLLFAWTKDYNKLAICMISTQFSIDTITEQGWERLSRMDRGLVQLILRFVTLSEFAEIESDHHWLFPVAFKCANTTKGSDLWTLL